MRVRIYKPTKSVMQSGRAGLEKWRLEYETETPRRPEPLMGWTASGDTLNQVRLTFDTQEEAVSFAREKGWEYVVSAVHERQVRPQNYSDNFKSVPPGLTDARKVIRKTKRPPGKQSRDDETGEHLHDRPH